MAERSAEQLPPWLGEVVAPRVPVGGVPPWPERPDFVVDVIRPDDLVNLHIDGYNLRVTPTAGDAAATPPRVSRIDDKKDAFLVVTFPPQNIAEAAFYEGAGDPSHPLSDMHLPPDKPGSTTSPSDGEASGQLVVAGQVAARLAGPSRLSFRIAAGAPMPAIPYTIEGLLDWSKLELAVPPLADIGPTPTAEQIAGAPDPAPPAAKETALELPYRLLLAPQTEVSWTHALAPVVHEHGRAELWHTRLTLPGAAGNAELWDTELPAYLRAVWSPDYPNPPSESALDPDLQVTDISGYDRYQIVILTSAFRGWAEGLIPAHPSPIEKPFVPSPVEARLLILSALGGWLHSRGAWDPPHRHTFVWRWAQRSQLIDVERAAGAGEALEPAPDAAPAAETAREVAMPGAPAGRPATGEINPDLWIDDHQLDLSEWVHVAAQGRDHYVKLVYEGFLYPFCNRAALIKVTERKFIDATLEDGSQAPVAYLIQRQYIVVREPIKVYPLGGVLGYQSNGLEMPIRQIRVTTTVTPDLHLPRDMIGTTQFSSWIVVDQANPHDYQFHIIATDVEGNTAEFTTPLIFYSFTDIPGGLGDVQAEYQKPGERRACAVRGQKVAFAARDPNLPSDNTTLPTDALYFDTQTNDNIRDAYGGFLPVLFKANVRLASVEQMLGTNAPTTIRLYPDYVSNGLDTNAGVFAQIVTDPGTTPPTLNPDTLSIGFTPKQGGGMSTPNMALASLTRKGGPTAGDPANAAQDRFDANDFFSGLGANIPQLFGAIKLTDILPVGGAASAATNAPRINTSTVDTPGGGKTVTVTFDWSPQLRPFTDAPIVAFQPGPAAALTIHGAFTKQLSPQSTPVGPGSSTLTGKLTDFTITLLESVAINVTSFAFAASGGSKPDVKVDLDAATPFDFTGDLTFVEDLKQIIPAGALGDGPSLDLTPAGVHVGFAISLPPAGIGVFSLQNVKFTAGLDLPFFSGSPVLDLAFAEREHPFILTVALFGGGGFFHLQADPGEMRLLEAAFEFGAAVSVDIGVASGGVHVMAGIYFSIQQTSPTDKKTTLTGFFRCGGELSVLGIASVSIEFELSFTYQDPGKATGQATVTFSVSVLFFSASWSVSVQKTFAGSAADPSFADLITAPAIWQSYAEAFA